MLLIRSGLLQQPPDKISKPYILIAGTSEEFDRVKNLLQQKNLGDKIAGRISVNGNGDHFVSKLEELNQTISFLDAKEIIFCAGHLSYKEITASIERLRKIKIRFFSGNTIVGSDDSTSQGNAISFEEEFNLVKSNNLRIKRLIDVVFATLSILVFPIHFLFVKRPFLFLRNCVKVLTGSRTWVGYILYFDGLPKIREGILASNGEPRLTKQVLPEENLHMLDYWYARDYEPLQDLKIILKHYKYLGG